MGWPKVIFKFFYTLNDVLLTNGNILIAIIATHFMPKTELVEGFMQHCRFIYATCADYNMIIKAASVIRNASIGVIHHAHSHKSIATNGAFIMSWLFENNIVA